MSDDVATIREVLKFASIFAKNCLSEQPEGSVRAAIAALSRLTARLDAERWQPIETAPPNVEVLLFCPDRGVSNRTRIELGCASHGWANVMSHHAWATQWRPLPTPPETDNG